MNLEIENLTFSYNSIPVLNNINLKVKPMFNVVIGPNAAGKSTLLKCIFGVLKSKGQIYLNGKDRNSVRKEDIAELIGYLPQDNASNSALTVFETVLLGKLHSLSWRVGEEEKSSILKVLEDLGIDNLAFRQLNELSGGQKQMVSIAQLMVRFPKLMLMDEPTNNLDLQNQLEIISLIKYITKKREINSIVTLHDLNLTARYADNVIILDGKGGIYAYGKPVSVITSEMISYIYGVNAKVAIDDDDVPIVTPISSNRNKFMV